MDMALLLKTLGDIRKSSAGNLTIRDMFTKLEKFNDDEAVILSNGRFLDGDFGSYRGYYEDLYIGCNGEDKGLNTVGEFKKVLDKALDEGEMTGYKGGDYPINADTLVWVAEYGCCGDIDC